MQVIDECMQAYKLGFKSFNSGKAMPNGFSKHQQDCFKIGFGDAKEGKQYPSTKNQESCVETQINAYSEGCHVE